MSNTKFQQIPLTDKPSKNGVQKKILLSVTARAEQLLDGLKDPNTTMDSIQLFARDLAASAKQLSDELEHVQLAEYSDLATFFVETKTVGYNAEAKETFRKLAKKTLQQVAKAFDFKTVKLNYNPAGIASSGDFTLMGMFNDEAGVYININMDLGASIFYRTITHMKDYTGGPNHQISLSGDIAQNLISGVKKLKN